MKIPPGIADGAKMRLRGQGESHGEGPAGDILLTVHVGPHPFYHRQGNNLEIKLPVTLAEAVEGAKVDVPTPRGTIALRVPPKTSSGTKLRIKGHGIKTKDGTAGDLLVEVQIDVCRRISTTRKRSKRFAASMPKRSKTRRSKIRR